MVERLTHPVRDPRAGYGQTLDVLRHAKAYRPAVLTKTSLMLGLGETEAEIRATMATRDELAKQVKVTLWHELGHLRGADDDQLRLRGLE